MSCILHIETSTSACSVAVSEDGQNVFKKEDLNGPSHAVSLGVFVDEALSFADLSLIHISEPTRQAEISYAVFCLKKKKNKSTRQRDRQKKTVTTVGEISKANARKERI